MTDIRVCVDPMPGSRLPCGQSEQASESLYLVGRELETARLSRLLSVATAGRGAVLVVRGDEGTGKTALLDYLRTKAVDHRVLSVRGVADEAETPFSSIQFLFMALAAEQEQLEPYHRAVLDTALGLQPGPAPETFSVGVALVALLTRASRTGPIVCVADDAHWLDPASQRVLSAVGRRLSRVPVLLVIACAGASFPELPELVLSGLKPADARTLFNSTRAAPIDEAVVGRILDESAGNPRAIIDCARTMWQAGGYTVIPSTSRNAVAEEAVSRLPVESRLLLIAAAAEPLGDPVRLWRAADHLELPLAAAEPLESAGFLSFGLRVRFHDPRLRSVIYGLASPNERRRVHHALAEATDQDAEPDRYVWHLAQSVVGPDEVVGGELTRCVPAACDRGGLAAAAAFQEQAFLLTANSTTRVERAIQAADLHHQAGDLGSATRVLEAAELGTPDSRLRARVERIRARLAFDTARDRSAILDLLHSAQSLDENEPSLARQTRLEAIGAAIFTGQLDVVDSTLARLAHDERGRTDRLLESVIQWAVGGYASAIEPLKLALKALDCDHADDTRSRLLAYLIAANMWDEESWDALTGAELVRTREIGGRAVLPYVLTHRALVEVLSGRFAAAGALVAEARAVGEVIGTPPLSEGAVVLAAWRGLEHPDMAAPRNERASSGVAGTMARYARAVLANSQGAYDDAVDATREVIEHDGLDIGGWSLVELIEASARSGDLVTATIALSRLTEQATLSGTDWALGVAARSRALLTVNEQAEEGYREAIEHLSRSRITTDLARTQLLYGEWLRRQGRRLDSRAQLHAARERFAAMGADAFASRAARELLAAGERAPERAEDTKAELTPQELRIAVLARDGRSNPKIASMLFISPRTVEYHLHKVFAKLRVRSRNELHLVLTSTSE
ncbi:MAG TPA: AAA family ATPase [Pseudonocardiaceae bacterium]|nr:AAA family ATPase [Pseudonocardiaceae bacterium]